MSEPAKVGNVLMVPCADCGVPVSDPLLDFAGLMSEQRTAKLRQAHPALCSECRGKRESQAQEARQREEAERAERVRQEEEARYEMRPCLDCEVPVRLLKLTPKDRGRCPGCLEKKKAEYQEEERKRRAVEEKARLERIRATLPDLLGRAGVPRRWQEATFDRCADLPAELVARAHGWAEWPNGLVFLSGRPGCGKTFLAVSVVAAALSDGILSVEKVRFIDERAYLDGLKAGFGSDWDGDRMSETYRAIRGLQKQTGTAREIELLVLDDLAASRLTDWGRAEVAGLIEHRHAHDRATIVTSNLSLDELAAAIDPRVASRLAEDGQVWQLPARDLRLDGTITKGRRAGLGNSDENSGNHA